MMVHQVLTLIEKHGGTMMSDMEKNQDLSKLSKSTQYIIRSLDRVWTEEGMEEARKMWKKYGNETPEKNHSTEEKKEIIYSIKGADGLYHSVKESELEAFHKEQEELRKLGSPKEILRTRLSKKSLTEEERPPRKKFLFC